MPSRFHPRSGVRRAGKGIAVALLLLVGGCNYSFRAGAGFPDYVRTIAILPFENDTNRYEVTNELNQQLVQELPRALGVQPAGQDVADVVLRGIITGYDVSAPSYRSTGSGGTQVLQRQVTLRADVQIVDPKRGVILWEGRNLSAQGQYLEASETEEVARQEAIKLLVQAIVDGAQSNW